jgi:NAD(P)-dependent dehydrogenase (short-subunit alcohol dehydrogenase family)
MANSTVAAGRKGRRKMGDRLKGKVAIVTGAGSIGPGTGNGKATSVLYAREGAKLILVDMNPEAADETKRIIDSEGGECVTFQADVTRSTDCKNMADKCLERYGRIDILHNNVGIEIPGGVEDMSEEDWDKTMAVNLKSMFLTCKHTVPHMVAQGSGSIINISSVNAIRNLPYITIAYSASKAGVIAFTRELAMQYAAKGVRANTILPGMMNTPLVVAALTDAFGGDVAQMMKTRDEMCPTGKQGEPWDVASLSVFLASDEAKYMTGAALVVDGGLTCNVKPF